MKWKTSGLWNGDRCKANDAVTVKTILPRVLVPVGDGRTREGEEYYVISASQGHSRVDMKWYHGVIRLTIVSCTYRGGNHERRHGCQDRRSAPAGGGQPLAPRSYRLFVSG